MMRKIEAQHRFKAEHGWLKSYHLFSFANYMERGNMNFGTLRVFNDDYIDGHSGFGAHSHDNMEIITIVHQGTLTHQDSMGNNGKIIRGEVQYMSAGTGVTHAELNQGDEPVHLYQIWIFPNKQHESPQYAQRAFGNISPNILVPVASGSTLPETIHIRADATLFLAHLEAQQPIRHTLREDRGLFVYIREGSVHINGVLFEQGDQARITNEEHVLFVASRDTHLIALDVPLHLPF
jgi:redox-sensitive bicupin YhaK (pirin superfamily)